MTEQRPEGCKHGCREPRDCNGRCGQKRPNCACAYVGRVSRENQCPVHNKDGKR